MLYHDRFIRDVACMLCSTSVACVLHLVLDLYVECVTDLCVVLDVVLDLYVECVIGSA